MQEAPDSQDTCMVQFAFQDKKGRKIQQIDQGGMGVHMAGWMDECMHAWMHGWMHGWMDACAD